MTTAAKLSAARAAVRAQTFGTPAWEAAMVVVRRLVDQINAARPAEPFTSVDSGEHPTRYIRRAA